VADGTRINLNTLQVREWERQRPPQSRLVAEGCFGGHAGEEGSALAPFGEKSRFPPSFRDIYRKRSANGCGYAAAVKEGRRRRCAASTKP